MPKRTRCLAGWARSASTATRSSRAWKMTRSPSSTPVGSSWVSSSPLACGGSLQDSRGAEMSESESYVIAGASLAGAKAAEALRDGGFGGPVILIGDEDERPYERPPLSKDYLLGKAERDTIYVHPESWYAGNGVELRLGIPVTGIPRAARRLARADGSRIAYARLLLATGSSPRRLTVPGGDADGVLYLRRVGDSDQIKATFQTAARIAVIGAGWIGLECTAAARAAGVEVTVLEAAELPLLRVLGPEVA